MLGADLIRPPPAKPPTKLMNSRRFIATPSIVSTQISARDVCFASKADMCAQKVMSALPPKADIDAYDWNVR
jgi:hypothetical protein